MRYFFCVVQDVHGGLSGNKNAYDSFRCKTVEVLTLGTIHHEACRDFKLLIGQMLQRIAGAHAVRNELFKVMPGQHGLNGPPEDSCGALVSKQPSRNCYSQAAVSAAKIMLMSYPVHFAQRLRRNLEPLCKMPQRLVAKHFNGFGPYGLKLLAQA